MNVLSSLSKLAGRLRPAEPKAPAPPVLVAVGDSLTAGMQDMTLDLALQKKSFPPLIARQAGLPFQVPEVHGGAIPPRIFEPNEVPLWRTAFRYAQVGLAAAAPLALMALGVNPPAAALYPLYYAGNVGRQKGSDDTQNLAVPGFELRHLHETARVSDFSAAAVRGEESASTVVVEAPLIKALVQNGGRESRGMTEVDRAVAKQPDMITLWAGNNDILASALFGNIDDVSLTPMEDRPWLLNPGEATPRYTERAVPGLASSLQGPDGVLTRLLAETDAEIMLLNVPDVTTIPHLLTVGEKVGPLPYQLVLPDGTDITEKFENFVIPSGVRSAKPGQRTEFPEGTRIGLGSLLSKMYRLLLDQGPENLVESLAQAPLLGEDNVLDPEEIATVQKRTQEFNDLLKKATENPRVHLVDVNGVLNQAKTQGYALRGQGPEARIGTGYTGLKNAAGQAGLFSYDGVHPSDVGQAVVANLVLDKARQDLGTDPRFSAITGAPAVDEKAALAADPRNGGQRPRLILSGVSVDRLFSLT